MLLIAYMWSIRGFFSSFLHMVCVIVAGAVAFGLWEPVSLFLLDWSPPKGILASVGGNAWAIGLAVPFVVALLITRVAMDKIAPANVHQTPLVDYIGGGACGLVSGILTVGVLAISLGSVRLGDSTVGLGYKPIWYTQERATGGGSLVYNDRLLIPADMLTARLYSHLSLAAFYSSEPLAKWHPEPHIEGPAAQITYNSGSAKNTIKPRELSLTGVYIVGSPDGTTPASQLLTDAFIPTPQKYVDINGEPVSQGMIFAVKFEMAAGAKETTGQHMISPGQLRLLVQPVDEQGNWTGEPSKNIFPLAVISQGDSADADSYGRWRFEAEGVHVSSVGGGSSTPMAAEFLVPRGYRPLALYVKNTRLEVADLVDDAPRFPAPGMRDGQIRAGTILKGAEIADLDRSRAVILEPDQVGGRSTSTVVSVTNRLGREAFQSSAKRGLLLDDEKRIVSGDGKWLPAEVGNSREISQKLKVDRFATPDGTMMVQVDVSVGSVASLLGPVGAEAGPNDPFYLFDTAGTPYQAVGYIYKDREQYAIYYYPGDPLNGTSDLSGVPSLTAVRDDQTLKLLFLVSRGVSLKGFAIGNSVVFELKEPRLLNDRQD
ncbi:MAG: CvpA family protein [Planctomycetota bacterium]|nr:MAG: CvpA family protein [Planctomycetota bacterium]